METIKRLSDVDPRDLAVVERVFGQRIDSTNGVVLILKTLDAPAIGSVADPIAVAESDIPSWCNVLDGMSGEDVAEFNATLSEPVRFTRTA